MFKFKPGDRVVLNGQEVTIKATVKDTASKAEYYKIEGLDSYISESDLSKIKKPTFQKPKK